MFLRYVFFFLFLSNLSLAQSKQVLFQIKTGAQFSNQYYKDLVFENIPDGVTDTNIGGWGSGRYGYRLGINLGFYAEYKPAHISFLSVIGGLSYRQRGFIGKRFAMVDTNNRLDYFSLDIGSKLRAGKIFYWVAGMRYDYLFNKRVDAAYDFYMNTFRRNEFSPFVIQGINLPIFKQLNTAIEFEINQGIQKLNFNEVSPLFPPGIQNRLKNFAMSINLVIGFKNKI